MMIIILFILNLVQGQHFYSEEFDTFYQIRVLHNGNNEHYPQPGDTIKVKYEGYFPLTKRIFDKTRKKPFETKIGIGKVIKCWDEIIQKMSVGMKINFICPSQKAYGQKKMPGLPANSDLAFDVELLSIEISNHQNDYNINQQNDKEL